NVIDLLKMYKSAGVILLRAGSLVGIMAMACLLATAGSDETDYNSKVNQSYRYPFGKGAFLPSQAKAASGGFLAASSFPTAEYCASCHADVHKQWRESAHANSFRAPFYKKNVDLLIEAKGIEFSRHCEGCHNPIALFSGALTSNSTADRSFDE